MTGKLFYFSGYSSRMFLLNAGIPFIFIEIPFMLVSLVIVITVEFYILTKSGIKFSSVVWSNIISTIVGVPLSNIARRYFSDFTGGGGADVNPFEASLGIGDYSYEGNFMVVILIIIALDFLFSVLIEWIFYRLKYKLLPGNKIFPKTLLANAASYGVLLLVFSILSLF